MDSNMRGLHRIPRQDRPALSFLPNTYVKARTLLFNLYFFTFALLLSTLLHLTALPLRLIPIPLSQRLAQRTAGWTKDAFASLLLGVTQFGPSELCVTADDSIDLSEVLRRDQSGKVTGFKFQERSLWISNHQCYLDWIYLWIIFSMGSVSTGLCIILKASLQWAPIVGPAMQLFSFAFVSKQKPLQNNGGIYKTAKRALEAKMPFTLLLFPEGTLVSRLTRPKSAAFAEASGVPDLTNTLLPRSTGLLYCLRTLLSIMPDLTLYDVTIGYEGVPDEGYAQDYYTLQSTFGQGISPPVVHIHLRKINLGGGGGGGGVQLESNLKTYASPPPPLGTITPFSDPSTLDKELTVTERATFQEWTRQRWIEKDLLLKEFYEKGEFPSGRQGSHLVHVGMRRKDWVRLGALPMGAWMVWMGVRTAWNMI